MRFLELLKRPDSGRRATRNDPRSGITGGEPLGAGALQLNAQSFFGERTQGQFW
jgi:hypothetical protein